MDLDKAFLEHIGQPSSDGNTCNVDDGKAFGMDLVESSIMPEGWIGLRTEGGTLCVGPSGSLWVPAFNIAKYAEQMFPLKRQ